MRKKELPAKSIGLVRQAWKHLARRRRTAHRNDWVGFLKCSCLPKRPAKGRGKLKHLARRRRRRGVGRCAVQRNVRTG